MSKLKFIIKSRHFLFSILFFFYIENTSGKNFSSDVIWIEEIPIFSEIIINKKDAIEFDSSDGKIIIIQVNLPNPMHFNVFNFYNKFFKEKNWVNVERNRSWVKKISKFSTKSFIIENKNQNMLTFKIITQNF